MEPILTRCGYRCDLCLAYRPNVAKNPSNQQKLSDGWFKYFGFRLPPSEIIDAVNLIFQSLMSREFGGSDYDEAYGITVDANGNAYVTGYTSSTDFPTAGAVQNATVAEPLGV